MPYVAIKCYPREDEAQKVALVEKINEALLEVFGVPQKAVTITLEEIPKEEWEEKVQKPELAFKTDKMYISHGEKKY